MSTIPASKVIYLKNEEPIIIGSSFSSDIFYQIQNLIPSQLGRLFFEHHDMYFELLNKFNAHEEVYIIPSEADVEISSVIKNKRRIYYGDLIRIMGLNILYLEKILVVYAFDGDMRVALHNRR